MRTRRVLLAFVPVVLLGAGAFLFESVARPGMRAAASAGRGNTATCTTCHGPKGPPGGEAAHGAPRAEPWSLAASPDGKDLYVACEGTWEVDRVSVSSGRRLGSRILDGAPKGLALSPDGRRLAVSVGDTDRVAFLDVPSLRPAGSVRVGRQPAGLVWDAGGRRVFVANAGSSDVSVVDAAARREVRRLPAGREPFVAVRSPDGSCVAVVSRRTELARPQSLPRSRVTLIDARTGLVRRDVDLPSCHMSEGAAFTPDGRHLLVPALLARNRLPILQVARGWVMSSVVAVVGVEDGDVRLLPLTEANEGFADPSGIALTPDGARAYVAAGGLDQVAELDVGALLAAAREADAGAVQRLSLTRRYLRRRIPVGSNPRAVLALAGAAAGTVAVSDRLGDALTLLAAGTAPRRVTVGTPQPADAVLRGARAFHSARFAFQHSFSCRSCHPGGHTDGLTYDFDIDGVGRNVVLNRSLLGVAGTGPFKWVGSNPTLKRQCGPRFAMVLTRADPMDEAQLTDLVAFLHSLRAPRPWAAAGRVGGRDTGAVARGKRIFERSTRKDGTPIPPSGRCITCHPPPLYTSRTRADVGTRGPRDDTGLFDVPHLIGIGSKAPYLHDGRALTLEEIWTAPGVGNSHGVVSDLDKVDLNDLVAFLEGL
jgi:YVTN family beta-propeller protein